MPKKFSIEVSSVPPRFSPIGKFVIERGEECINCGRCALACVYGVHSRQENDPRCIAEPLDQYCKGCFRCVQECPKEALTIVKNDEYRCLGDLYWTPEIIAKNWNQAETGKIPVSGAGYTGPFAGDGFDSMWTDMSEIVRPTRDGIHGREYISTAVDIGRRVPRLAFDAQGNLTSQPPPMVSIPLPIIFNALPFGKHERVSEALAKAASLLGTFAMVDADERSEKRNQSNMLPLISRPFERIHESGAAITEVLKRCKIVEVDYEKEVLTVVKAVKKISPTTIIVVRVPCGTGVEEIAAELAFGGIEVFHLRADINGKAFEPSTEQHFVKDLIWRVHQHLVDLKIRDEVTLIVSGGIALPEHVAKAIICGADVTAIDLPLLLALECRYCRNCLDGSPCPVSLEDIDPEWGAQRIINLVGAWQNQLLEVLGAMGLREVRRLRGEIGRAIVSDEIQKETFDKVFAREVLYNAAAKS